jgi:hypothetical protein
MVLVEENLNEIELRFLLASKRIVEIGSQDTSPMQFCEALTDDSFQIQVEESMKEVIGKHRKEPEGQDCNGMMPVDVIDMPVVD